jgi:hypothetical protein
MAVLSPSPKAQFLDANGAPLVGGKVYTYAAGTTTPLATFTTAAAGTANTNPVILDARGEANIFYTNGVSYKIVLTDSADATIWTVDNVVVAGSMSLQNANAVAITGGTIGSGVTFNGNTTGTAANVTGVVAVANGGTGASTAANARTNLSAAASGANVDITSLAHSTTIAESGTIGVNSIGFRGAPQNLQLATYTLQLTDNGKHIRTNGAAVVIPDNGSRPFPTGAVVAIFNDSAFPMSISILPTDTLRLAGTATTGTRTLAQYGLATCVKVDAGFWVISGAGLT